MALIVDARLAQQPDVAQETHDRLFDTELSVQNIGRLVDALSTATLPGNVRAALTDSVIGARETEHAVALPGLATLRAYGEDPDKIAADPLLAGRLLRVADSLAGWQLSTRLWREEPSVGTADALTFESPVTLMFGNLPGSALVSRAAAAPAGSLRARFGLDFPAQAAIRIGTAVVIAATIGSVLSERRFYWAVLAVFVSNMGTNTSAEQLTKAAQRVAGTVIGILAGSLLAHAVGHSTWSIAVVLVALFFGIYFMRASYALMVLGITITVSQLYVQLGEYTNQLLVLRLEETAIGAAVTALAALVIFPIHARQASRVAARDYYARLGDLLDALIQRLNGEPVDVTLPTRGLDNAGHALQTAARPMAQMPFRSDEIQHNLLLLSQAAHHLRNVAAEVGGPSVLSDHVRRVAASALGNQAQLVRELEARISDGEDLRREGDLLAVSLDHGGDWNERQLLRHIARLGETLAELSDNLQRRLPEPTPQAEVDPGLVRA